LIPAYEPDEQLITLARRLSEAGFAVVVVDDGSGPAYGEIFAATEQYAHILVHEENRGKGAALKTGMRYIRDCLPQAEHFITCDADGQHRVEDVLRVSRLLQSGHKFVLTTRRLRKDIPLRSKIGNDMSRVVYALLTKRYLSDNQSGLRGFHRSYIDWMVQVEKDKYDYEMNVLYYAAKKSIRISTIPIDAIYINNNQSSHFHPIMDTIRIYKSLFYLAGGAFIGFFVAELLVLAISILFGYQHLLVTIPTVAVVSYLVNIIISKYFIFRNTCCYDYWTLLIHQVLSYVFYTLGCVLFYYAVPQLPLWVSFNLVFLACLPLRYWLYKFTFIALRTRE
jgi:glycosyltransferase involved in cell wall biosynthesis